MLLDCVFVRIWRCVLNSFIKFLYNFSIKIKFYINVVFFEVLFIFFVFGNDFFYEVDS